MLKKNPLVSVILSVYNSEKYIESCIRSILNQTFKNFEFIIINDASNDKTESIILNYAKNDYRIKILNNKKNLGLTKSLNIAIKKSIGKYIVRIDSDEYAEYTRIEKQLNILRNSKYGVVGTNCINIYPNNKKTEWGYFNDEEISKIINLRSPFPHGSTMFKSSLFHQVKMYNEKYSTSQDFDLWIKLSSVSKITMINEFLTYRYIDDKSISKKRKIKQFIDSTKIRLSHSDKSNKISILFYSLYFFLISLMPNKLFLFLYKKTRKL